MTAAELRTALIASGVLPPGYDFPLTYERIRGLRLSFLGRMGRVSEPARYERAARLCGELVAAMDQEFTLHPERVRTHWLKEP